MGKKAKRGGGHGPPISTRSSPAVMLQGGDATSPPSHFFPFQGAQLQHKARGMPFNSLLPLPPPPPQPSGYLSSSSQIK